MAQRFGRAGGTWSVAGTWSATSGGASDGAGLNAGDDVVLDSNSTGTFTIGTSISIATLDCTGLATGASGSPFAGTLSHSAAVALTMTGLTFKLSSGMTYTPVNAGNSTITFASTSGTTAIALNGKALGTTIFNGAGGTFQIQGDSTLGAASTSIATFTAGTFDANSHNVTIPGNVVINGGTLTPGSGAWNVNGVSGSVWSYTSGTINAGSWTLNFGGTQTSVRTLALGTQSYNIVNVSNPGASGVGAGSYTVFTGAVTIATLGLTAPLNVRFTSATIFTLTNAFNWAGSLTSPLLFDSGSNAGAQGTISSANNGTISGASLINMNFTGGGTFTATNSVSLGNNTGITISPPAAGAHIIGG